eukprot:1721572-Pleurochrysis_carterae.AAC.1
MGMGSTDPGFSVHWKEKYTVSAATGEIEWKASRNIDIYYMDDKDALADYLQLENRAAASNLAAFECSNDVDRPLTELGRYYRDRTGIFINLNTCM